jgi:hypothetical protein
MGNSTKAAIAIGAAALIGGAGYLIYKQQTSGGGGPFLLQILTTPSAGGTTSPAPSPSGIYYPAGTVVTITATPASGYTVGDVLLDLTDLGAVSTFQVTMNMDHEVDVTFYLGGVPPQSNPVQIIAAATTIITGYYACQVTLAALNAISNTTVGNCDQNWTLGNWVDYPLTFKVIDANGNGVPKIPMTFYSSPAPDASKYQGYLALDDQMTSPSNPITKDANGKPLVTGTNGEITIYASYWYGLTDKFLALCKDAGLYVNCLVGLIPWTVTPYNGWNGTESGVPCFETGKGGDKTVPATPTLITITATIPKSSIQQAQTLIYCQLHAHMK